MESDDLPVPKPSEASEPALRSIRVSDDERDAVIERLRHAVAEGRIDMGEFEERSALVYNARFEHDLEAVVNDLPVAAAVRPVARPAVDRRWMLAAMSGREWRGSWRPAQHNRVITVMGGQEIDLTEVEATDIEILAFTVMGGLEITVPRGALVDDGGFFFMGASTTAVDPPDGAPTMRIKIRSYGLMGASEVFHPKKRKGKKKGKKVGGSDRPELT